MKKKCTWTKKKTLTIKKIFKCFSDNTSDITVYDKFIIGILLFFYLILSFYHLGTLKTPQSYYKFQNIGDELEIELLGETQKISKIRYYTGPNTGTISVLTSLDGKNFTEVATLNGQYAFTWKDLKINSIFKYIKLVSHTGNTYLGEVQLYNKFGDKILVQSTDKKSQIIIDEAETVPKQISYLNSAYFDEIYFARSAYEYTHNIDTMEWTHPPIGKLIMSIPILLFGMSTFSYRLMGTLAGVAMIPILYFFAKSMFKNSKWATLAAILMTFDCFHFCQSRMGTVDVFLVLFIMLSALFMYQYIDLDNSIPLKKRLKKLFLSGFFIGCAISTKWTGLYAGLALAIIFFGNLIYKNIFKKEKDKDLSKIIIYCCLFFVFIPVIIYMSSYLFFPNVTNYKTNNISGIIQQIKSMYNYHSNLNAVHPFQSKFYTWPFMYKPVWYYSEYYGGDIRSTIVGIGNPAIWWFGVLAIIFVLVFAVLKKQKEYLYIIIFILCQWIPYMFIGRLMFMYHFFPVLPFLMLAIVAFIKWLTEKINSNWFYISYVVLVIFLFILFYPVISGMPITKNYIESLKWLSSWLF